MMRYCIQIQLYNSNRIAPLSLVSIRYGSECQYADGMSHNRTRDMEMNMLEFAQDSEDTAV